MKEEPALEAGSISGNGKKEAKKMEANANDLVDICRTHCKGAQRGEMHGKQIEIILPVNEQDRFKIF